jgi:hypothetical protein
MFLYDLSINSQHLLRYLIKADMDPHTRVQCCAGILLAILYSGGGQDMSWVHSPSTDQAYSLPRTCRLGGMARSTVRWQRQEHEHVHFGAFKT